MSHKQNDIVTDAKQEYEDNEDTDTTNMSLSYDYWREREDDERDRAEERFESYSLSGYDR